jgi:AmmeMemoRadiSam system protein A
MGALAFSCGSRQEVVPQKESLVREHKSGDWSPGLSDSEMETLFSIANDTLDWCVEGGESFDFSRYELTDKLQTATATFVTLKIDGMLRGCIGSLAPVEELYRSVHNNAVNAAMKDPRFRPVTSDERGRLEVDISILSPIVPIGGIDEFRLGEHGIILEKGRYRSVYLPEVALEQRWDVEQTLSSLSEKAGLPSDGWREGASFSVFSSVVLGEGR